MTSLTIARAEPITPDEAREQLTRAQAAGVRYGSFRHQTVETRKGTTITTTRLTSQEKNGPKLSRIEVVRTVEGHPERTTRHVTIVNAEGRWQLYENKAVLMPPPFNLAGEMNAIRAAMQQNPSGPSPADQARPAEPEAVRRARTLATHVRLEGERTTEEGRVVIKVTRVYDEEAQQFLHEIIERQLSELKKQFSFAKRMLVGTYLATQGGVDAFMPAREVFTIDVEKNRVVASESFNAKGKRLRQQKAGTEPEQIADLPPETFAFSAGMELIRPKNAVEAAEIAEKLEAELKKASGPRDT